MASTYPTLKRYAIRNIPGVPAVKTDTFYRSTWYFSDDTMVECNTFKGLVHGEYLRYARSGELMYHRAYEHGVCIKDLMTLKGKDLFYWKLKYNGVQR